MALVMARANLFIGVMVSGVLQFFCLRILRSMAFAADAFKTSHVNQSK
jgi:hypothetical protein